MFVATEFFNIAVNKFGVKKSVLENQTKSVDPMYYKYMSNNSRHPHCVSGDKLEDGDKYRHKDRSRKGRLKARLEEFGRGEDGAKQTSLRDRFKAGRESEEERYVSVLDKRVSNTYVARVLTTGCLVESNDVTLRRDMTMASWRKQILYQWMQ